MATVHEVRLYMYNFLIWVVPCYCFITPCLCITVCYMLHYCVLLPLSSTKNTILKKYDGRFKDIFEEIYEK